MVDLYNDIIAGEEVFISTKNKYWFLQRFKDANGVEAEFKKTINPNLFRINLKS
jgi:hypothetical protein